MSLVTPEWARRVVAPHVMSIPEYIPGKPVAEVEREYGISGAIKLASNENPLGPSPKAMEAILRNAGMANIYPESSAPDLRSAIAEKFGLGSDQIILGNGSDEIMQMLAHVFVGIDDEVIMPEKAFSMYKIVTRLFGGISQMIPLKEFGPDLEAMASCIGPRTRLLFVSNPHSPTGVTFGEKSFEKLLKRAEKSDVIVILDEAYREYCNASDCVNGIDYVRETDHLIVLRTFSKIYGLAGLRVGYGVSSQWLTQLLNRVKPPFNVNLLAQVAAIAAISDNEHVRRSIELNQLGRRFICDELRELGFKAIDSQANFVAFQPTGDAGNLYLALLKEGIIVRHLKSFGLPDYIRVTVGLEDQNKKLIEVIRKVTSML
ncbi:MAG: histidinol-phosphate transaminase [Pseudomonadota bacterium]